MVTILIFQNIKFENQSIQQIVKSSISLKDVTDNEDAELPLIAENLRRNKVYILLRVNRDARAIPLALFLNLHKGHSTYSFECKDSIVPQKSQNIKLTP